MNILFLLRLFCSCLVLGFINFVSEEDRCHQKLSCCDRSISEFDWMVLMKRRHSAVNSMDSILVDRVNRLRGKTWMTPSTKGEFDRSELFCITHSTFTITSTKYRFANRFRRLTATQNRTVLDLENTIITNSRRLPINYCVDQIAIDNSIRPSELTVITDKIIRVL